MLFESMLVIASLLLILSGGAKIADRDPTMGALRVARLPATNLVVVMIAAVEVVTGTAALLIDHPGPAIGVAALYVAFALFVANALRQNLPIQSCGCFGKTDTPPSVVHLVVNTVLAGAALVVVGRPPLLAGSSPSETTALAVFCFLGAYLTYLVLAELPKTLAMARRPAL